MIKIKQNKSRALRVNATSLNHVFLRGGVRIASGSGWAPTPDILPVNLISDGSLSCQWLEQTIHRKSLFRAFDPLQPEPILFSSMMHIFSIVLFKCSQVAHCFYKKYPASASAAPLCLTTPVCLSECYSYLKAHLKCQLPSWNLILCPCMDQGHTQCHLYLQWKFLQSAFL